MRTVLAALLACLALTSAAPSGGPLAREAVAPLSALPAAAPSSDVVPAAVVSAATSPPGSWRPDPVVARPAVVGPAAAGLAVSGPAVVGPAATGPAVVGPAVAGPAVAAPRGDFGWPLEGTPTVLRPFDPPENPYGPGHRGVDLAGWDGQPVLAAGAGVVAFAGLVAGRPVVSIDHPNGLRTTYEPVAASVVAGQRVDRSQVIGLLQAGHEGCPVAACLHWGVRRGEEYLDPLWLLAPGHVRLLPCDAECGTPQGST